MTDQTPSPGTRKKTWLYNLLFVLLCGGLLLFLWRAPAETTAKLPQDEKHARFQHMDKKEAEKQCEACHSPEGEAPLAANHPPKERCLFCHKQQP